MRRGIGQRIDNLHLFDDRARPPVRHDQRQRILMFRANVNKVDVQHIARAWVALMKRLGYTKFVAQGGDWGAVITEQMGLQAPPELPARPFAR